MTCVVGEEGWRGGHNDSMFRADVRQVEKWVHYIQVSGEPRYEQLKDYLPLQRQWQCWQQQQKSVFCYIITVI